MDKKVKKGDKWYFAINQYVSRSLKVGRLDDVIIENAFFLYPSLWTHKNVLEL